ncbi:MAG: hypothetical protein FWC03_02275 [Treponema sp.]|nr:hypothetical protein [Treponema sp.]
MRFYTLSVFILAICLISCGDNTALIWTDRPEFAFYSEYFNTTQNQYKVTVRYFEYPAAELERTGIDPDIVVGSWLKNSSTGANFRPLDNLFGSKKLAVSAFYSSLLTIGRIEKKQYLLPVSFNVPALIFSRDKEQGLSNQFTIGFNEIKNLSNDFNAKTSGAYTQLGFSPLWSSDFLLVTAILFDTSFNEASPLIWDNGALEQSMDFIYNWTQEINSGNQGEEDFTFKYFYVPAENLIQSGRILFSYKKSSDLFTLSGDNKNNLDFRWIMDKSRIPITEDIVYLGIPKKAKSQRAARAFIQWFFRVENQNLLLEFSKANRINETVFGISGGFSALNQVTEQIFPRYYPELLGRMPPSEFLMPPNILPGNWAVLKERVILPYIYERARRENADDLYPLDRRVSDWTRMNR